jgi:hypothetical protein
LTIAFRFCIVIASFDGLRILTGAVLLLETVTTDLEANRPLDNMYLLFAQMPCCPYIIPEGNLSHSITSEFGGIVVRFTHEMFDVFEVIVNLLKSRTTLF